MTDHELFEAFVSTDLPADRFHHEQHVRVAWLFLCRCGMPAALGEFTAAIKRFAEAKGAHGLYHETITWAFLLIIGERQARQPASTWADFAKVNIDLLLWKPSILERYYSKELLMSKATALVRDAGQVAGTSRRPADYGQRVEGSCKNDDGTSRACGGGIAAVLRWYAANTPEQLARKPIPVTTKPQ